jgi:hypothetical protein
VGVKKKNTRTDSNHVKKKKKNRKIKTQQGRRRIKGEYKMCMVGPTTNTCI